MSCLSYTKRLLCVKFRENRSIPFEIIAFFGNPTWRSTAILDFQICDIQRHQNKKTVSLLKFVKVRENWSSRFQVITFDGSPTWRSTAIFDSQISVLNVTSKTKIYFRICVSNFLEIGGTDCELLYCIELQYGGRLLYWIFNNANFEVTPRT
jgi:hypothetical protein